MIPSSKKHQDDIGPKLPSFLDRPADKGIIRKRLDFIEAMTPADIETVVTMHVNEISGGILTEMGPAFLTLFYRQMITDPHARGYVIRKNDAVFGFIAGSSDPETFFKNLFRSNFFHISFIILTKSIAHPSFLLRFSQRVRANLRKENMAESLAAAVINGYKAKGYGIILLKKLFDDFRNSGVDRIQCDVAVNEDDPAVVSLHQMYQKGGYVQNNEFRVGGVTYKRYQRDLTEWIPRRSIKSPD